MPKTVVHGGEVEVHLAGGFGREVARFQVHHEEAAEMQVVKEKVEVEVLPADFEMHLPTDEGKAGAEFEEKFFDVRHQALLDGALVGVVPEIEEVEDVGIFGDLLREVRLRRRERRAEVGDRFALASIQGGIDLEGENVARPTVVSSLPGVPEAGNRSVDFFEQDNVVRPRNCGDFWRRENCHSLWQF